jgi:hypothetical protein
VFAEGLNETVDDVVVVVVSAAACTLEEVALADLRHCSSDGMSVTQTWLLLVLLLLLLVTT